MSQKMDAFVDPLPRHHRNDEKECIRTIGSNCGCVVSWQRIRTDSARKRPKIRRFWTFGASGPAQSKLAQRGPKSAKIAMKMSSDGKGAQCGPTRHSEIDSKACRSARRWNPLDWISLLRNSAWLKVRHLTKPSTRLEPCQLTLARTVTSC